MVTYPFSVMSPSWGGGVRSQRMIGSRQTTISDRPQEDWACETSSSAEIKHEYREGTRLQPQPQMRRPVGLLDPALEEARASDCLRRTQPNSQVPIHSAVPPDRRTSNSLSKSSNFSCKSGASSADMIGAVVFAQQRSADASDVVVQWQRPSGVKASRRPEEGQSWVV